MLCHCSVLWCAASVPAVAALSAALPPDITRHINVIVGPARSEAAEASEPMSIEQLITDESKRADHHYSQRRSMYSTFRRLPGKSVSSRPGQCGRGIFTNQHEAGGTHLSSQHAMSIAPGRSIAAMSKHTCGHEICCCTAVVTPAWKGSNGELAPTVMKDADVQVMMDALTAARILTLTEASAHHGAHGADTQQKRLQEIAASLNTFLSKWMRGSATSTSERALFVDATAAHLSPLCGDIPPAGDPPSHHYLAQLLFTAEESETIYYYIVRLQDVPVHSTEETNRLLTITSLRVLFGVAYIRHSLSKATAYRDHHHLHPSPSAVNAPQGDNKAPVHEAKVLCEVYETVIRAATALHLNQSAHHTQVVGHPLQVHLPIGMVDIASAFAMRRSSPMACMSFLCEMLHSNPSRFVGTEAERDLTLDMVHDLIAAGASEILENMSSAESTPSAEALAELMLMLTTDVLTSRNGVATPASHLHGRRQIVALLTRLCQCLLQSLPQCTVAPNEFDTVITKGTSSAAKAADGLKPSPLSRLLSSIVEWQRVAPSWMNQELSGTFTQVLDGIVQAAARSGGSASVLQLLKSVGLTNVLHMERIFFVAVPILRGLQSPDDLIGDFIEHAVADAAMMYAGTQANMLLSADSAAAFDAFLRAVEKKKAALQTPHSCSPPPDSDVVSAILEDFALLGKHVFSSQQMQVRDDDGRHRRMLPGGRGVETIVDPDAALLGGPVEFARYLLNTLKQVWLDIKSVRLTDDDDDSDNHSNSSAMQPSTAVPTVTPITVAPSVVRDFTLLLERVVVLSMSVLRHQVPLVSPALSKIIDSSLQLPNLHDEYRRKLFLMVNVASSRSENDLVSPQATPEALLKLTAALPLQFLPWSSTQITKEVLASSHGHGPRYLHLLRTAVDLQLPPSTARSRIAGVLEVYKLVRSQRDKLPPLEYTRLLLRCLMSLPLSYIFSSWTFFLWWTFVGFLVVLHVTGWSWEAMYVVKNRRLEFAKPLTGGVGRCEQRQRDRLLVEEGASIAEHLMGQADTLVAHPTANTLVVVVHDVEGRDADTRLQFRVAEASCQSMDTKRSTPFVLHCPNVAGGGMAEYLVADDILRDCAQRIRREANTTWNPFQRLVFNLFPLFRPTAEESLIKLTTSRAASKGVPFTFFLMVPDHLYMTEASLQRLREVFARQYVSSLVVVVNHTNPSLAAVSRRLEFVGSHRDVDAVLDAARVCQREGEEERWNITTASTSLGAVLCAFPMGYQVVASQPTDSIDIGAVGSELEVVSVSPLWKYGTFSSLVRPKPEAPPAEPVVMHAPSIHHIFARKAVELSARLPSIFECRVLSANAVERCAHTVSRHMIPVLREHCPAADTVLATANNHIRSLQFVDRVHGEKR